MFDFGNSEHTDNAVLYGDLQVLESPSSLSCACFWRANVDFTVTNWFGFKGNTLSANSWVVGLSLSGANISVALRTRDSANNAEESVISTGIDKTNRDVHSLVVTWDGSTMEIYIDGVSKGTAGHTEDAGGANTYGAYIGRAHNLGTGAAIRMGHPMVWIDKVLTSDDAITYDGGKQIPASADLDFWVKCDTIPGAGDDIEQISGTQGSVVGNVSFVSDAVDAFFQESTIDAWLQMATLRLMQKRRLPQFARLKLPWRFMSIELMELLNKSLYRLPAAASALDSIEDHAMIDKWRRQLGTLVGIRPLNLEHAVELTIKRREPIVASYFSTEQLTSVTSDEKTGLARTDVGGALNVDRGSRALIPQESSGIVDMQLIPVGSADGQAFIEVSAFDEKLNHQGFLAEEGVDHDIIDSCFGDDFATNWTEVESTAGNITVDQGIRHAFPQSVSDTSIRINGEAASENYIKPAVDVSVLAADGHRRLYCIHSDRDALGPTKFAIQRTNGDWWNDSTEAWQASLVWNDFPAGFDGVEVARLSTSAPIPVEQNESWEIRIGTDTSTLHQIYCVDLTVGKFLHLPVKATAVTVTTSKDTVTRERDSLPQMVFAGRGTASFKVLARQDVSWMADGDEFALLTWQYGAGETDFDVVKYRKPAGANAQWAYERYINSGGSPSLDARATLEQNIVPGTEYSVEAVWTSDSDGELGLAARTLRIRVDKVVGTDAQASQSHSSAATFTKIWKGCAPDADGSLRAMNWIHHIRFQPRCVPDEEVI